MKLQAVFRSNMAMNTPYYLNDIKTIEVSKIREIPLPPWQLGLLNSCNRIMIEYGKKNNGHFFR